MEKENVRNIKVVYEDDKEIKVLKGVFVKEDDYSITLRLINFDNDSKEFTSKEIIIGKKNLIKATFEEVKNG